MGNLLISVIWELIENFWLYEVNIKFAHRRDSVINSITDILFFILGGVISWTTVFFYRCFLLIISIAMIYLVAITGYFWSKYALK